MYSQWARQKKRKKGEKKEKKPPPPSEMGKKDIKNYFNLASIFPQKLSAKYFSSIKNKENPITYFFFFTSSVVSDGLSTAVVTTLFAASIKVTYKLLSQGRKETSIQD